MLERYKTSLVAALFGLFLTLPAHSAEVLPWTPITQAEFKTLPPYCEVRLKSGSRTPEWVLWAGKLGKGFIDVHHYCQALMHLQRYYSATRPQIRRLFLQEATHNLDYMIRANHSVAELSILPDVYVDRGRTLLLQKKDGEALQAFLQAIKLNPATVSAYVALSDLSLKAGNKQNALQYAEDGLKNVPDNRALQHRYQALSGRAFVPSVASDKPAAPVSTPSETEVAPVKTAPVPAVEDSQKIGTPTNPYCRFCP